jgi:dolichol-phosphate mannosyltransferase
MDIKTRFNANEKPLSIKDSSKFIESDVDFEELTIVIPTLNEEEAIGFVIEDLMINGYEKILIVDGKSTDSTVEIAEKYGVKIIYQEGEGKTGAITTAIKYITTPYFALIDGDCTYGAEDIVNLFPHISNNLEVIGVRKQGRENITSFNRFGNWVINTLFNIVFSTGLTDVCSGMYMLQTKFAKKLILESKGFDVEVEIAAHAAKQGSITETPIGFSQRRGIQKLHPIRDGAKIIKRILQMGYRLSRTRLLYLLAFGLLFPGLILFLFSFQINILDWSLNSYTMGLILTVLGLQGGTLLLVDSRLNKLNRNT